MQVPKISINDVRVHEGQGNASFEVTLDAPSASAVTVNWATASGGGTHPATGFDVSYFMMLLPTYPTYTYVRHTYIVDRTGYDTTADYNNDWGTVTFAPGETSKSVAVVVADGPLTEDAPEETFLVKLSGAVGADIADDTGVATIVDRDAITDEMPVLTMTAITASTTEPWGPFGYDGVISYKLSLSWLYSQPVTVDVATKDGTAQGGLDFTPVAETLVFAPGEREKIVSIAVTPDDAVENPETFSVELSNLNGATMPAWADTSATATISDFHADTIRVLANGNWTDHVAKFYAGPVKGLAYEFVGGSDGEVLYGTDRPEFINLKGGSDAVNGFGGDDVLDGGLGSNFLTGAQGTDTFFVDARETTDSVWSTVTDLQPHEAVTFWGLNPADFIMTWSDGLGAPKYTGLTLTAQHETFTAALTLTGYSKSDLLTGKLVTMFGHEPVSGSDYLYIYAT